jgi:hypothetical protein
LDGPGSLRDIGKLVQGHQQADRDQPVHLQRHLAVGNSANELSDGAQDVQSSLDWAQQLMLQPEKSIEL